jgi:hypothetical protein
MVAEPLGGAFILTGARPRLAWTLVALLMFLLTFGQTMLQSPDVVNNWLFTVLTLTCAALSEPAAKNRLETNGEG